MVISMRIKNFIPLSRMRNKFLLTILLAAVLTGFFACDDEAGTIGGSLASGEVRIAVDSLFTVTGESEYTPEFDARSNTLLVGKLRCPEFGDITSAFVSQLMPAMGMDVNDSITVNRVDSMVLKLNYKRGAFTGDSLAPQQLRVFALNKRLPSDISSDFDPSGYYDPSSPLGLKNYTASALGMNDTVFLKDQYGHINVKMPLKLAREFFTAYREKPEIFQWPSTFANYFPGLYVENTFGSGCIVNITVAEMATYYHYNKSVAVVEDGVVVYRDREVKDSVTLFSTAPEVLSSNIINVRISDLLKSKAAAGKALVVSPCGYRTRIKFPAQAILDKYWSSDFNLAVINNLMFTLPVNKIKNDYGINPPPYLLLIKSSELDEFFASNKVPDGKTSFWAGYSSTTGEYVFTSMREYIVDLMKKGGTVSEEDASFTIVPVMISTENDIYSQTVVTKCTPFVQRPVMCELDLDGAKVKFTYSIQKID